MSNNTLYKYIKPLENDENNKTDTEIVTVFPRE